jgi:protein MpaA
VAVAATPVVLGHSVQGRPITAVRLGDPAAPRRALVVAGTHGDEPGARRVTRALRRARVTGVDLWVVDALNPDGLRRGTRQNARGVDLNRNFPAGWRRSARGSRFYGGPRPSSEPETRAIRSLVLRVRPEVTLWLHQPYRWVYLPDSAPRTARYLARLLGLPTHPDDHLPGTAMRWAARAVPGNASITVEYGDRAPDAAAVRRSVHAILRVAREGSRDGGAR